MDAVGVLAHRPSPHGPAAGDRRADVPVKAHGAVVLSSPIRAGPCRDRGSLRPRRTGRAREARASPHGRGAMGARARLRGRALGRLPARRRDAASDAGLRGRALTMTEASQRLDRLRAEQVEGFYRNSTPGTIGSILVAAILASLVVYVGSAPPQPALLFFGLVAVQSIGRLILIAVYWRTRPPISDWRRWAFAACTTAVLGGLTFGLGTILIMDPARVDLQFIINISCAALTAGAITAFGSYLPAYYCGLFTIMVPNAIWAAAQGDPTHIAYAALAAIWIPIMAMLGRTFSRILSNSLRLQFDNLDLATDARHQKELA